MNKATYYIDGMHCPSCEILMREEIGKLPNVSRVSANAETKKVTVDYTGSKPTPAQINELISEFNYCAYSSQEEAQAALAGTKTKTATLQWLLAIAATLVITVVFLVIDRWVVSNANVTIGSSIMSAFLLGVVASLSSCAALVGGLLLSQSKNWQGQKLFPYLQFNLARVVSFFLFGGLLGAFGSALTLSLEANFALIVAVSLVMIFLGLQMLNIIPFLNKFQLKLPTFVSERVVASKESKSSFAPILLGAGTFFLPCTFTLAAQLEAMRSGSFTNGMLTMGVFSLGTLPLLLFISFTSKSFSVNKNASELFLKVAGLLVILFALYTINNQLNVMGYASLTDLFAS